MLSDRVKLISLQLYPKKSLLVRNEESHLIFQMEDLLSHAYQRSLQYERKLSCLGDNKIRKGKTVNRKLSQRFRASENRQSSSTLC